MILEQLPKEQLDEMSKVEIAHAILEERKQPMHFNELVEEIGKLLGLSREEIDEMIPQFYTDLNIDGRFINVGGNTWGYKGWYPVEQYEDDIVPSARPKKKRKKSKAAVLDEEFEELEDEDLEFDDLVDEEDYIEDEEDEEDYDGEELEEEKDLLDEDYEDDLGFDDKDLKDFVDDDIDDR